MKPGQRKQAPNGAKLHARRLAFLQVKNFAVEAAHQICTIQLVLQCLAGIGIGIELPTSPKWGKAARTISMCACVLPCVQFFKPYWCVKPKTMGACMHACMRACVLACVCACVRACVCVCVCARACGWVGGGGGGDSGKIRRSRFFFVRCLEFQNLRPRF